MIRLGPLITRFVVMHADLHGTTPAHRRNLPLLQTLPVPHCGVPAIRIVFVPYCNILTRVNRTKLPNISVADEEYAQQEKWCCTNVEIGTLARPNATGSTERRRGQKSALNVINCRHHSIVFAFARHRSPKTPPLHRSTKRVTPGESHKRTVS